MSKNLPPESIKAAPISGQTVQVGSGKIYSEEDSQRAASDIVDDIFAQLRQIDTKIEQDQAEIQALKAENRAALADLKMILESHVGKVG
jgi:hypothetical protein